MARETYIPDLNPAHRYETLTEEKKKKSSFLERKQSHMFDRGATCLNEQKSSIVLD